MGGWICGVLAATRRDHLEDLGEGARYDAAKLGRLVDSLHSERLACARLAVSEDRPVKALENRVDDARRCLLVEYLPAGASHATCSAARRAACYLQRAGRVRQPRLALAAS